MSIHELFDLAIQAEERMSVCYKEMSQICQNESISKELMILSKDEIDHMNLLATGKNYLKEAPDIFGLKSERITELKIGLNKITRLIESVQKNRVNLEEALNDAVEIERLFEQFHLNKITEVKEPSLRSLFEALSAGDKDHKERLMKIITSFYHSS